MQPASPKLPLLNALFSLEGRHALVTGGGSGLGAEMALSLAGAGARLTLVGRRVAPLEATRARINAAGGSAELVVADLATEGCLEEALTESRCAETVDVLVNAAGLNVRKPAAEVTIAEWNATLNLMLTVPFLLAREAVKGMARRGYGRIINIGSLQSVRAFPNSMPYGAAKGGIVQLTRAMAEAWSPDGVCCNAIAPGLFPTELTESIFADPALVASMAAKTCLGRNAVLEDIRGLVVFLASPSSGFLTGQTIFLDGGLTAR